MLLHLYCSCGFVLLQETVSAVIVVAARRRQQQSSGDPAAPAARQPCPAPPGSGEYAACSAAAGSA